MGDYTAKRNALGSKRKLPSGRWQVCVSRGYTRDGRQRRAYRTVDTERAADLAIAELAVEMGRDASLGDALALGAYYREVFVPSRAARLSNATMRRYDGTWRADIEPRFAGRALGSIGHLEIQAAIDGMERPRAMRFATTLRVILRAAWDDGFLSEEPMRHRLRFPPDEGRQLGVWDAGEVARAMDALRGSPLEALWLSMTGAGLRREEAYALYWSDVSFRDGLALMQVDDAVTIEDGRKAVKTRYSERVAIAAPPFSTRMGELAGAPSEPICAIALTSVARTWRKLWEEEPRKACPSSFRGRMLAAGVPYLPLSRMRATHETLMQAAGVGDSLNNRAHGRAGNSQIGYRNYLNPDLESIAAAARAMGETVR